jgi:hypothetical protein
MTATLTFTVLIENYPEYAWWLRPTEYVWLTLLGLQMINNGVHWASDYPLGIAMGYSMGKIVSRLGRKPKAVAQKDAEEPWLILPDLGADGPGVTFSKSF